MPGTWKSDYLLNLVLVARADGEAKPIEVLYLSRCRTRLEADHRTLADAVMRSYWEEAVTTGGIITDENALADLIRISLIDGATSDPEQAAILRFIDAAKIPRSRVEAVFREAAHSLAREAAEIARDNDLRIARLAES